MITTDSTHEQFVATIVDGISSGALDNDIASIERAIAERLVGLRKKRTVDDFPIGSTVRFNDNCGTAYLRGNTAVVVGRARTKLTVTLDKPVGRFVRVVDGIVCSAEVKVPTSIVDPA